MNHIVLIMIIIFLFVLFCNIKEKYTDLLFWKNKNKNKNKELTNNDYFIDNFDIEKTPYSHQSDYDFRYLTKCNIDEPGDCINSRCVYKNLRECQDECKTGCQYCGQYGLYRCEMQ
jgi:hypothetical protein